MTKILFPALFILCMQTGLGQSYQIKISQNEIDSFLAHHNRVRKDVGSPPLVMNQTLSDYAAEWAEYLAKNNHCRLAHRYQLNMEKKDYGENIFWTSDPTLKSPVEASIDWYSEIKDYQYRIMTEHNSKGIGHYTQMVWSTTTAVGIGMAACPNLKGVIVVANYDPAGNIIGEKPY